MKSFCVMPVYNQERELPALLAQVATIPVDEFLIVDNGSTDGSTALIRASGCRWERQEQNLGIGAALRRGAEVALADGCDIICNIAGNGKMVPAELRRVIEPIQAGQADYVTGSRFLPGGQYPNLPLFRRLAIPLVVNTLVLLLFRRRLTDATCGLRGYTRRLLEDPGVRWRNPRLNRYQFEYYLYAKALRSGYRCREVPCSMIYPGGGKPYSKIPPLVGWWHLLEPWLMVGLGREYRMQEEQ